MGAPGGGLKQCAQGRGQDRTCGVGPHMPKATFPFVTARQWVDGWRLFFLNTATVSAGHSQPCIRIVPTRSMKLYLKLQKLFTWPVQYISIIYE